MRQVTQGELKEILELHKNWRNGKSRGIRADLSNTDLRSADLRSADLRSADLRGANLRGANLRNADLDYSCLSLWCGIFDIKTCKRLPAQILYHFCRFDCDDPDVIKVQSMPEVIALANQFHLVDECGLITAK